MQLTSVPPEPMEYSAQHLDRGSPEIEKEIEIKIRKLVSSPLGQARLMRMRRRQLIFFVKAIAGLLGQEKATQIYSDYLSLAGELMSETVLMSDVDALRCGSLERGFVVPTGHFGIAKATKISIGDLQEALLPVLSDTGKCAAMAVPPNAEPFPLRTAAILETIARALGWGNFAPHEVHMWYPYPFNRVQRQCRVVGLFMDRPNQYLAGEAALDAHFATDRDYGRIPTAVIFPESGTSGKRGKDHAPYSLGSFSTGFVRYAAHASVPVVPIVQVVDADARFATRALKPIFVKRGIHGRQLADVVEGIRQNMQGSISDLRLFLKGNRTEDEV